MNSDILFTSYCGNCKNVRNDYKRIIVIIYTCSLIMLLFQTITIVERLIYITLYIIPNNDTGSFHKI